jgi:hypothetical protein
MWLAVSPCSIADTSANMLAPWMATPTALSRRKSSARFVLTGRRRTYRPQATMRKRQPVVSAITRPRRNEPSFVTIAS